MPRILGVLHPYDRIFLKYRQVKASSLGLMKKANASVSVWSKSKLAIACAFLFVLYPVYEAGCKSCSEAIVNIDYC